MLSLNKDDEQQKLVGQVIALCIHDCHRGIDSLVDSVLSAKHIKSQNYILDLSALDNFKLEVNGRFDEVKSEIAGLKSDIAGIKSDIAGIKSGISEIIKLLKNEPTRKIQRTFSTENIPRIQHEGPSTT